MEPLTITASAALLMHCAREIRAFLPEVSSLEDNRKHALAETLVHVDDTARQLTELEKQALNSPELQRRLTDLDAKQNPDGPLVRLQRILHSLRNEVKFGRDHSLQENIRPLLLAGHRGKIEDLRDLLGEAYTKVVACLSPTISPTTVLDRITVSSADLRPSDAFDFKTEVGRQALLEWLSPLDFRTTREHLLTEACPDVRSFTGSQYFQKWTDGRYRQLYLYGEAGSGKTFLSASVAEYLETNRHDKGSAVVCVFMDETNTDMNSTEALLGSILRQMIEQKNCISCFEDLHNSRLHQDRNLRAPTIDTIKAHLIEQIRSCSTRIYLIIDGVDQCPPEFRFLLLNEGSQLPLNGVSMMVTSRSIQDMEKSSTYCDLSDCLHPETPQDLYWHCNACNKDICQECFDLKKPCDNISHRDSWSEPLKVEIYWQASEVDLQNFVMWQFENDIILEKLRRQLSKSGQLLQQIARTVARHSNGKFIMAKLNMDLITAKESVDDITNVLDRLPRQEIMYFSATIEKIKSQTPADADLGMTILALIRKTRSQPIRFVELRDFLRLRFNMSKAAAHDFLSEDHIIRSTRNLVSIENTEEAYVRPFDLRLQTYLEEECDGTFNHIEMDMAQVCLTYLLHHAPANPLEDIEDYDARERNYPFLTYASRYWGEFLDGDNQRNLEDAFHFIQDPDRVETSLQAAWNSTSARHSAWGVPPGSSSLHVYAWFGSTDLLKMLKDKYPDLDTNVREPVYQQTPLMFACRRGRVDFVGLLLGQRFQTDVTCAGTKGNTALFEAVASYSVDVLQVLIPHLDAAEINRGNPNQLYQTALTLAAKLAAKEVERELIYPRRVDVLRILLSRQDINVNLQDRKGYSALFYAAIDPKPEPLQILLQREDIDISIRNEYNQTPLHLASERGYLEHVARLIEHAVRHDLHHLVNLQDGRDSRTPLCYAVYSRNHELIRLLLDRGADVKLVDDDGRTVIHHASNLGDVSIIELLLDHHAPLTARDNHGRTPLHEACRTESIETIHAIETLINRGADVFVRDTDGRTPYKIAWLYGNETIMKMLVTRAVQDKIEQMVLSDNERLPIWSLVRAGVMNPLLEAVRAGVDPLEKEPASGDNALHWAVFGKRHEMLKLLLDNEHIPVDEPNRLQRTPLLMAAWWGNETAAKILLKYKANSELADKWKFTALAVAQRRGSFPVAVSLIEHGATLAEPGIDIQQLFFAAINQRNAKAIERLIGAGADLLERDPTGRLPMQLVLSMGTRELVRILRNVKKSAAERAAKPLVQAAMRLDAGGVLPKRGISDPARVEEVIEDATS